MGNIYKKKKLALWMHPEYTKRKNLTQVSIVDVFEIIVSTLLRIEMTTKPTHNDDDYDNDVR